MAKQPSGVQADQNLPTSGRAELRKEVSARLKHLHEARLSWWRHWGELAAYLLPRRYKWLITANEWRRGSPINQRIIDSSATVAARVCASGMMSGITSPSRPWFRLTVQDDAVAAMPDVKLWLDAVVDSMEKAMASSNYYVAKAIQYLDLVIFGTAPMIIYEDPVRVLRCFNPCAGEYYAAAGPSFTVDTLYRKFTMTIDQLVREFGVENCSPSIQEAYKNRTNLDRELIVNHAIEPNPNYIPEGGSLGKTGVPAHFMYREVYWEEGGSGEDVLRVRGFLDQPFSCPRWDAESNEAYGRSPAMDALGDVKQLQLQQKRKSQAIDKEVNPPMVADISMKNFPASLRPGEVTYVTGTNGVGFKPAFQTQMNLANLKTDMDDVRTRIKAVFFNDLFLMISNLDTVRTATEIDARKEEKLIQLGPVLERFEAEGLNPDVDRIFKIMARAGRFPPPPQQLDLSKLRVTYVSMLAEAQRASSTSAIERVAQFIGGLAAAVPSVLDNMNTDEMVETYADLMGVSPKILRSPDAMKQMRDARNKAQQQQAAMQQSMAAAQGAQTLSKTDVGGGQNALQAVLGGGS